MSGSNLKNVFNKNVEKNDSKTASNEMSMGDPELTLFCAYAKYNGVQFRCHLFEHKKVINKVITVNLFDN